MDMLFEPCCNFADVFIAHGRTHIEIFAHGGEDLRRVSRTQRICGEVADVAAVPMHVLHDAFARIWHVQPEIFLVFCVPDVLYIILCHGAVKHTLFYLVSNEHVQGIGELVGLGADKTRFGVIYVVHEVVKFHALEFLSEQVFEHGEVALPELTTAADVVFEEARLAFMQSHGGSSTRHSTLQIVGNLKFIQAVPHLVNGAEDGACEVVFVIVIGYPHVAVAVIVCVGMFALPYHRLVLIEQHHRTEVLAENFLLFHGEGAR